MFHFPTRSNNNVKVSTTIRNRGSIVVEGLLYRMVELKNIK